MQFIFSRSHFWVAVDIRKDAFWAFLLDSDSQNPLPQLDKLTLNGNPLKQSIFIIQPEVRSNPPRQRNPHLLFESRNSESATHLMKMLILWQWEDIRFTLQMVHFPVLHFHFFWGVQIYHTNSWWKLVSSSGFTFQGKLNFSISTTVQGKIWIWYTKLSWRRIAMICVIHLSPPPQRIESLPPLSQPRRHENFTWMCLGCVYGKYLAERHLLVVVGTGLRLK